MPWESGWKDFIEVVRMFISASISASGYVVFGSSIKQLVSNGKSPWVALAMLTVKNSYAVNGCISHWNGRDTADVGWIYAECCKSFDRTILFVIDDGFLNIYLN